MSTISTKLLKPHPKNQEYYDDLTGSKYEEIKRSIQMHGIRDPIKILPDYTVIAGHQRLRIAKELGIEKVPVVVLDISPEEAEYLLIADNEERRQGDDNPMKKARRAKFLAEYWNIKTGSAGRKTSKMIDQDGQLEKTKTLKDIAEAMNTSKRNVNRLLKLNDLIPELQEKVATGELGVSAGEIIAHLYPEEQRTYILEKWGNELGSLNRDELRKLRKEIEEAREREKMLIHEMQQAKQREEELEKEVEGYREKINKLQAELQKMQEENKKGYQALTKLMEDKNKIEKELEKIKGIELDNTEKEHIAVLKAEKDYLEKEIKKLNEEKKLREFDIRDLEMEIERIQKQQTSEDTAIRVLRKNLEPLTSAKGEIEYALKEVEIDPYGNLLKRLKRYTEMLDDINRLIKTHLNRLNENAWKKNSELVPKVVDISGYQNEKTK